MPAPRFSLRTLLVAVTVVSIGCAIGGGLWNRSVRFQELHDYHYSHANTFMPEPSFVLRFQVVGQPVPEEKREYELRFESHETWRLYHAEMAEKYLAAAKKPWWMIPSDPPEPLLP